MGMTNKDPDGYSLGEFVDIVLASPSSEDKGLFCFASDNDKRMGVWAGKSNRRSLAYLFNLYLLESSEEDLKATITGLKELLSGLLGSHPKKFLELIDDFKLDKIKKDND